MEKWFIKNKKNNNNINRNNLNIDEILFQILLNRDINTEESIDKFLKPSLDDLHSPILLKDLIKGSNILLSAIKKRELIRIVGDYDADGIMSTYILYRGLKKLGANIDYYIPHRVEDGYGINLNIVNKAFKDNIDLIITCDNGISAFDAINHAVKKGMDVIVTDHHDVPKDENGNDRIVEANAVINPKQLACKYPFKGLCGAGVAFKLVSYLYEISGIPKEEVYSDFLAFVAFATICDVMELQEENRIIVKFGLPEIENTNNLGFKALIDISSLKDKTISVYTVGFILGPSINSSGRLESAEMALELLLTDDYDRAYTLANELRELNSKRQSITNIGLEKVVGQIESSDLINNNIIVVYEPSIHESIAGIIAGRIKEKYNKPSIVLTKSQSNIKGSGRSIEKYNMIEGISKESSYLMSFGGHRQAAGLSLKEEDIVPFRKSLNENSALTKGDLVKEVFIDYQMPFSKVNFDFINRLKILEPYGIGNPQPIFGAKNLSVLKADILGKNKNVLKLQLKDDNVVYSAISFQEPDLFINAINNGYSKTDMENILRGRSNNVKIDIVYTPEINEFRGNSTIQIKIKSYRLSR